MDWTKTYDLPKTFSDLVSTAEDKLSNVKIPLPFSSTWDPSHRGQRSVRSSGDVCYVYMYPLSNSLSLSLSVCVCVDPKGVWLGATATLAQRMTVLVRSSLQPTKSSVFEHIRQLI